MGTSAVANPNAAFEKKNSAGGRFPHERLELFRASRIFGVIQRVASKGNRGVSANIGHGFGHGT